MIDSNYDGQVFRIALSDVPERKTDLVAGRYELPAERVGKTVAVKTCSAKRFWWPCRGD
jgi:hypothetical protein